MYFGFVLGLVALVAIIPLHEAADSQVDCKTNECLANDSKKTCCKPSVPTPTADTKGVCTTQDTCCGVGATVVGKCGAGLQCCKNNLCTTASVCSEGCKSCTCSGEDYCCFISLLAYLKIEYVVGVCASLGVLCIPV